MTLNDQVIVTLTQTGADIINYRHQRLNKQFTDVNLKDDYNANDEWPTQLWCVFEMFGEVIDITMEPPFFSLEPEVKTR